jgi:Zn-dependent protease with chaperone function
MSKPKAAPPSPYRLAMVLLLAGYYPFLALLCLGAAWFVVFWIGLIQPLANFGLVFLIASVPAIAVGLTVLHVLLAIPALFQKTAPDEFEFTIPDAWLAGLYDLVNAVARKRDLPPPDQIRLSSETVAHVYEDERGDRILVIGGMALAVLSEQALGGVVAHELAHFAAGDTQIARAAARRYDAIGRLEYQFACWRMSIFNPLYWMVHAYHWFFVLIWAADSRRAELAADQHEIDHVGPEQAAATIMLVAAMQQLPWARLSNIARTCAADRERIDDLFSEQVRRARACDPYEWEEARKKCLKRKTALLDSHPCLKDRLKPQRVSSRKALALALDILRKGRPASELVPAWPVLEKLMSDQIMALARSAYGAKMEIAQLVLGKPMR